MARKLLFLLMGFCLAWGIAHCMQEAEAGWAKTGPPLDRGWYLTCGDFGGKPYCLVDFWEGTEAELDEWVATLNEIVGGPVDSAFWYKWVIPNWIKIDPPFKYIEPICPDGEHCV